MTVKFANASYIPICDWHNRVHSAECLDDRHSVDEDILVSASQQDREDYEGGQQDRDLAVLDQLFNDITAQHPDSEAYYKGRRGEPLDEDVNSDGSLA